MSLNSYCKPCNKLDCANCSLRWMGARGGPNGGGGFGVVGWAKTPYRYHSDGPAPAGCYLGGITVARPFRRQGVAAALTEARLLWIWERADSAWDGVHSRNQAPLPLHQPLCFEEVGR